MKEKERQREKESMKKDAELGIANGGCDTEAEETVISDTTHHSNEVTDGNIVFEDKEFKGNAIGNRIQGCWAAIGNFLKERISIVRASVLVIFALAYNAYFIAAIHQGVTRSDHLDYCDDVGLLIILSVITYLGLLYFWVVKPYLGGIFFKAVYRPLARQTAKLPRMLLKIPYLAAILACIIFIIVDSYEQPRRLVSASGVIVLVLLGFVFSKYPGYVVWRHVIWGLILQFVFALMILRWEVGRAVFSCIGDKVSTFLSYTDYGSRFVFGFLVDQEPFNPQALNGTAAEFANQVNKSSAMKFVFMFKVLSVIYFFNFFISMFYYLGIMQWCVAKMGWLLQVTVGTTVCESVMAAANIFLGQSEAPLMIKPYIPLLTRSEIHAIMTGGMATIAGSVLAAYISVGIDASHLLTASVMSAPAALAYAKLLYPETKKSKTTTDNLIFPKSEDSNILDAAANGAVQAVFLVGNIGGSLIAFLACVSFINGILSWFGGLVGASFLTLEYLFGLAFYPLSIIMGVECGGVAVCCADNSCKDDFACDQCRGVAILVGLKTIVNEFTAYDRLGEFAKAGILSKRSQAIATFALCGFSNPASIGTQIAALSYMAPTRRGDVAQVALRAWISASCACFLTACIAGTLIDNRQH